MTEAERLAHIERVQRQGYTVVENAIAPELVDALADALTRLERDLAIKPAQNSFEGRHTVRIYNLLAHGAPFDAVPIHASVLPIIEGVLDEGCLISSLSSIAIDPGETAQPIHADDQVIPLDKPHRPIVCNSMWALTDFTQANGATRLVPAATSRPTPNTAAITPRSRGRWPRVRCWSGTARCGTAAAPTRPTNAAPASP